jgi:ribA/ribD-fused uncharacterized protein
MFLFSPALNPQIVHVQNSDYYSIQHEIERLAEERGFVDFYNEEQPITEWLGNFYPVSVEYNGFVFANSEAAFQAQKFEGRPDLMAQFTSLTGDQAFRKARELSSFIRPDWFLVNVQAMKGVLQAKIDQNPTLAMWLDLTRDSYIVEHIPVKGRDKFWGDDFDGSGKNMLGQLWMEIRAEMRGEPVEYSTIGWQNYLNFLDGLK